MTSFNLKILMKYTYKLLNIFSNLCYYFSNSFITGLQSDNDSKGTDAETEVEVSSTSSDTEVQVRNS